jgi:hypothetical protein
VAFRPDIEDGVRAASISFRDKDVDRSIDVAVHL